MSKVAVTGGSGLIGRHLIQALLKNNHQLKVLSRKKYNIWSDNSDIECIQGELTDKNVMSNLLSDVDVVFNCAAELKDEGKMYETNVEGAKELALIAQEKGVKVICHISSAGVVGPISEHWVDEKTECHPETVYEKTKYIAEQQLSKILPGGQGSYYLLRPTNVVDEDYCDILAFAQDKAWYKWLYFMLKGNECAHLVHAKEVANAAVYLAFSIKADSGVYFIGCDEDPDNTFAYIMRQSQSKFYFFSLPIGLTYFLKKVIKKKKILHGRTRFSSEKLLKTGFVFSQLHKELLKSYSKTKVER